MKVKDLVILLQKCDQEAEVLTWNCYHDEETNKVRVVASEADDIVRISQYTGMGEGETEVT